MLRRLLAALVPCLLASAPATRGLAAEPEPAWLVPEAGVTCPSADALTRAFDDRFGPARFRIGEPRPGEVVVRLARPEAALEVQVLRHPSSIVVQRRLDASGECDELARTVALLVEAALSQLPWRDTFLLAAPPPPQEPEASSEVTSIPARRRVALKPPAHRLAPVPQPEPPAPPPLAGPATAELPPQPPSPVAVTDTLPPTDDSFRVSISALGGGGLDSAWAWTADARVGVAVAPGLEILVWGSLAGALSAPAGRGAISVRQERGGMLARVRLGRLGRVEAAAFLGPGLAFLTAHSAGYAADGSATLVRPTLLAGLDASLELTSRLALLLAAQTSVRPSGDRFLVEGVGESVFLRPVRVELVAGLRLRLW